MEKDSLFWKVQSGEIPLPAAAEKISMQVLDASPEKGKITTQFELDGSFTNPVGQIQGGFLAALLDDTLAPCVLATLGPNEIATTLNLSVSYISPGHPGQFIGTAKIVSQGGKIAHVTGELRQADQLIATATSTLMIRTIPTQKK